MKEKQQQLLFDKGITNVPSDALCSDNALEESLGMVYDNGEHRVIQKPKEFMTSVSGNLVYVHQDRYIFKNGNDIQYRTESSAELSNVCGLSNGEEIKGITSIGKTLIIATSLGMKYVLWDGSEYKLMGDSVPEVSVKFSLSETTAKAVTDYNDRCANLEGMVHPEKADFGVSDIFNKRIGIHSWELNQEDNAQNAIIGLVSKRLNQVKEDKKFAFPFWVRYAIRLYDGSYTHISNPVLMIPTARHNCNAFFCKYGEDSDYSKVGEILNNYSYDGGSSYINYLPASAELKFTVNSPNGIDQWYDIIKGVDIFISREARGFDIDDKWEIINPDIRTNASEPQKHTGVLVDGCWPTSGIAYPMFRERLMSSTPLQGMSDSAYRSMPDFDEAFGCYLSPTHYSENNIIQDLLDNSTFYKLLELDIQDLPSGETSTTGYINKSTLPNLETQDQLEYDDYFSYSSMTAEVIKTYNGRLHLGDIKRGFYEGFSQFSYTAYDNGNAPTLDIYVYIKSENGEDIVKKHVTSWQEILDIWYYYPDPRAYRVEFYNGNNLIFSLPLREHPRLHGAYYFKRLPDQNDNGMPSGAAVQNLPSYNNEAIEELPNTLAVSEVNNPFVFTAKGYHEVGMGKITGLAIQTTALGQEEHGKHPLLVFMTKGIWTMMVDDEGQYIRSDAFSREVSVNQKAITETDGAIFFASEKGLMLIVGSAVKCVSEQLSGKNTSFTGITNLGNFIDYLKDAVISYDYRDSLLWIFDTKTRSGVQGLTTCWIYSIKSGTFGKYDFGTGNRVTNVVNDYPDYLLQHGTTILSLMNRPNINLDGTVSNNVLTPNTYTTKIITRPMKLENALALKSIMQIKHIHDIENLNGTGANDPALTFKMYGSNNLKNWVQLQSLRGVPWKYYRFEYDFTKLKATDRFSGTMLVTQERRTDKLR